MEDISKERLNWHGRYLDYQDVRYFDFSSSGFSFKARGKKIDITLVSDCEDFPDNKWARIGFFVWEGYDDSIENLPKKITKDVILSKKETKLTIFNDSVDKNICVWVVKLSEAKHASCGLKKIEIDGCVINDLGPSVEKERIEVIGDSITCGYGIEGTINDPIFTTKQERADLSYAFLLGRKMKAEVSCVSWSGMGLTSHYIDESVDVPDIELLMGNLWPYTDKSICYRLGIENEVWDEKKFCPNKVIINLGTNDASFIRNKEDRKLIFIAFYRQLFEAIHRLYPLAKIYCAYGVMENSLSCCIQKAISIFKDSFPKAFVKYIPLELQKEEDGIAMNGHPSRITQEKICETIYKAVK